MKINFAALAAFALARTSNAAETTNTARQLSVTTSLPPISAPSTFNPIPSIYSAKPVSPRVSDTKGEQQSGKAEGAGSNPSSGTTLNSYEVVAFACAFGFGLAREYLAEAPANRVGQNDTSEPLLAGQDEANLGVQCEIIGDSIPQIACFCVPIPRSDDHFFCPIEFINKEFNEEEFADLINSEDGLPDLSVESDVMDYDKTLKDTLYEETSTLILFPDEKGRFKHVLSFEDFKSLLTNHSLFRVDDLTDITTKVRNPYTGKDIKIDTLRAITSDLLREVYNARGALTAETPQ